MSHNLRGAIAALLGERGALLHTETPEARRAIAAALADDVERRMRENATEGAPDDNLCTGCAMINLTGAAVEVSRRVGRHNGLGSDDLAAAAFLLAMADAFTEEAAKLRRGVGRYATAA